MNKHEAAINVLNTYSKYENDALEEIIELSQTLNLKIMEYRKQVKNNQKAISTIINILKEDGEEKEGTTNT